MKKFLVFFIICLTTSYLLKGQCDVRMYDIYTPLGSPVVTFLMCESSTYIRSYYDNYYTQTYPSATQIETYNGYSSTRKFNCHGYAWLRVEQGIDRWIGTGWPGDIVDPEKVYITDGSYWEVPQVAYPGKVFWASGDHTAITTGQQGVLISKWNEFPLMEHSWNYSPYGSSNLKYYTRNPYISGPANLCSSGGQYSVLNAPPNSYVQWSYDTTKITSYYGGNTWIALRAIGNGEGWVEATVTNTSYGNITLPRMTVWAGIPTAYNFYNEVNGQEVDYYDVALICPNITNCFDSWPYIQEMSTTNYTWHLLTWYSLSGSFGANGLCFNANGTVGSSISADVTNSCGTGYGVVQIYFGNNGCSRSYQYAISPNPASTLLTIEQLTTEEAVGRSVLEPAEVYDLSDTKDADDGSYTVKIWHEKKGKVKEVTSKKKEETIDVSGLEKGYYILHIRTKSAIYKEHLLVK